MIIGITGNSGSGKTRFSNLLKEKYDANIIDADKIAKKMSLPGNDYYNDIVKEFGTDIVLEDKQINRRKLTDIIFNDDEKRNKLNSITYKYVVEEIKKLVNLSNSKVNIIDAPLLIEGNLNNLCDIVISILADESVKLERICLRDKIDIKNAKLRIEAQPNNDFYIKNSNLVIINNENSLEKQVDNIEDIIESDMIKNERIVVIVDNDVRIIQYKDLLDYNIVHAFTIKPLDFGSNNTYESKKKKVNENYDKLCKLLKIDSKNLLRAYQTHTNNIKEVKDEIGIFNSNFINVDGIVTSRKNKILSLSFADCMPIYLYDKKKHIVGNIHSGWQGTVKKISKKAIIFMKSQYNCNPEDIICVIGPTIRKCHFEVKQDVKDLFYNTFKYMDNIDNIIISNNKNSYYIDTVCINKNLFLEEGIKKENIIDCKICTVCNSRIIHSFRKDGVNAGRSTSIICLK